MLIPILCSSSLSRSASGELPLSADLVSQLLTEMQAEILFEKVLTNSDLSASGRMVIPKGLAEKHLPTLNDDPSGIALPMNDIDGSTIQLKFKFWLNGSSRMFLLENTSPILKAHNLKAGDVMVFAKLPNGTYLVTGRKPKASDLNTRKPAMKKESRSFMSVAASKGPDYNGTNGTNGNDEMDHSVKEEEEAGRDNELDFQPQVKRSKVLKAREAGAAPHSSPSMYRYWLAEPTPRLYDGVFRSAPYTPLSETAIVSTRYGAWSVMTNIGGETFQAFFPSEQSANAALLAIG